jgi:excisionase family DNA binding protein
MNRSQQKVPMGSYFRISIVAEQEIRARAEQVGKQMGESIANLLAEILLAVRVERSETIVKTDEGLLTAEKVSEFLQVSKSKAYRMMQRGEIPAIHFGRTSRVRREDLEEFIRRNVK